MFEVHKEVFLVCLFFLNIPEHTSVILSKSEGGTIRQK